MLILLGIKSCVSFSDWCIKDTNLFWMQDSCFCYFGTFSCFFCCFNLFLWKRLCFFCGDFGFFCCFSSCFSCCFFCCLCLNPFNIFVVFLWKFCNFFSLRFQKFIFLIFWFFYNFFNLSIKCSSFWVGKNMFIICCCNSGFWI